MNKLLLRNQQSPRKGQATTELAIAGALVIMMLGYLMQQGFIYNSRQALEMYTFRRAVELSKAKERGVALTVSRDVVVPTFFTGIARQRLVSSTSVEINPWMLYIADNPADVGTYQLIQMNEKMIRQGQYILVPPSQVKISQVDQEEAPEWEWTTSMVREFDPQDPAHRSVSVAPDKQSNYTNTATISEDSSNKTVHKSLVSRDIESRAVNFENAAKVIESTSKDPDITGVEVGVIPPNITFTVDETIERTKNVSTPHP